MKIYLISQEENDDYDTYDSAVVCAENEEEARSICPDEYFQFVDGVCIWKPLDSPEREDKNMTVNSWAIDIDNVQVKYLGEAKEGSEKGIIMCSFNAG